MSRIQINLHFFSFIVSLLKDSFSYIDAFHLLCKLFKTHINEKKLFIYFFCELVCKKTVINRRHTFCRGCRRMLTTQMVQEVGSCPLVNKLLESLWSATGLPQWLRTRFIISFLSATTWTKTSHSVRYWKRIPRFIFFHIKKKREFSPVNTSPLNM